MWLSAMCAHQYAESSSAQWACASFLCPWLQKILLLSQVVVVAAAHACDPSTLGGRGRWISEFKASLVYRVSSRTARATQKKISLSGSANALLEEEDA